MTRSFLASAFAALVLLSLLHLLTGCGHGATACKVVDAAHSACTVVRFMAPDGSVREVRVSQDELAAFGQAMAAKRAEPK